MALTLATAEAKLAPSSFSALVKQSDLIVLATATKVSNPLFFNSSTKFKVNSVLKGHYKNDEVEIEFVNEVHEQYVKNVGQYTLLFLKNIFGGRLTGTHYGRSYWHLEQLDSEKPIYATKYSYPISMLKFESDLTKPLNFKSKKSNSEKSKIDERKEMGILLNDVMDFIKNNS